MACVPSACSFGVDGAGGSSSIGVLSAGNLAGGGGKKHYHPDEDMLLAHCWVNVSQTNVRMTSGQFSAKESALFNERALSGRDADSLSTRFGTI